MTDDEFLETVVSACQRLPSAEAVNLGGSRVRGDDRPDSVPGIVTQAGGGTTAMSASVVLTLNNTTGGCPRPFTITLIGDRVSCPTTWTGDGAAGVRVATGLSAAYG